MANENTILPVDHNEDLNKSLSEHHHIEYPEENQPTIFLFTSPYS